MTETPDNVLIYITLLAVALAVLYGLRDRLGLVRLAQHTGTLTIGAMIVLGALALWQDVRGQGPGRQAMFAQDGQIELTRARDGHYYATLLLNGAPVDFVVDTGATAVVLSKADAQRAGLDVENIAYFSEAMTANGPVATAPVVLDQVSFGAIQDRRVRAFVNGGEMEGSLLGMSYLNRFEKIEISGGKLILTR